MDSIYRSTTSRSLQSTSTSSEFVSGACHLCSKIFKNVKLRNRHIKRIHKIDVSIKKIDHIVCPLCEQETSLQTHENLRKHIKENHQVSIELITLEFSSKQEYETWKDMQKIETSYATSRTVNAKEHKILYYECNRSDTYGYKPHSKIRTEKSGGSIRIKGVCPSRLICKLTNQGQVSVSYWKTHAGHKEELRAIHLSKAEEKTIEEKLMAGVPPSRILQDSRKLEKPQLDRLALLTSQDLANLSKKYNVHKKRDQNDMVATTLKVQEWNANNKNYAFLFKKEGEEHDVLRKEDFAIGFMNKIMEDKLRKFPKIICMDGTHGTNKRRMDLTIMLVKDDRNAGFPVAFLLSNRLDQQVQEVFLGMYYKAVTIYDWYYLKDLKRIKMWAHCYRRNSGINTNMAIESLNNLLKTNYLKRNGRVGIEKLLDTIDELVETKMWKRIVDMKRPNANNYQDRTIMKSHRGAERNKKKMKVTKNVAVYGQYQVTSLKDPSLLQNVTLSQVCESECKLLFCRVCKICMHRYQCDCTVYEVKNTLCQHVHLVRMYEESVGTNSVLDDAARCLGESSIIKSNHEEEINEFIREKLEQTNETQEKTKGSLELQNEIKNEMEALKNEMEDLDDTSLTKLRDELRRIRRTMQVTKLKAKENCQENAKNIMTKRKMEKQEYFPSKKKKNN
uniref:Uncharacterized protein LOC114340624 isoform X3 n=1 Tax=Diabrotica virgifera virgifera TaxID=50390 RepID=A0A6P7GTP5_DIAVI